MALGDVVVTGTLAPTDRALDQYAVTDEIFNKGGYRSVLDNTERDAITAERRSEGMLVQVNSTTTTYILGVGLTNADWSVYTPGGAGSPTITLTGDITGSGTSPIATTLASIITAGTKGTVARSATVTVDVKGRVTTLTDALIQIPEAQVTGLVTDLGLKEDKANKGIANGYVPLNGANMIDPAYYVSSGLVPKGNWNATTNSPALSDGTGSQGWWYVVTVAGSQNLGSGVIVFSVDDWVIHDGTKYVRNGSGAPAVTGITNITTDSGTLTGATVVLNSTAQIHDSTNRRYQTDLQKAIQDASVTAGATAVNRYALLSELSGGITVTNEWNTPETYEDGLNSLGEGTLSTQMMNTLTNPITGVAYTTASMLAAYTFLPVTATANTWTYADVCVETAFRRMELAFGSAAITFHDNRIYQYNQEHVMPTVSQWSSFYRPNMWLYQGNSSRHYNRSGVAKRLWYRLPANQTDAVSSSNPYTSVKTAMYNMSFYGAGLGVKDSGDTCVMIGASYGTIIKNCTFSSADTGLAIYFGLHARVEGGDMSGNSRSGIMVATGAGRGTPLWTGASLTNSASNGSFIDPTNVNCANNSFAGVEVYGSDGVTVGGDAQIAFEGSAGSMPQHHIFMDGQASTLVKMFTATNYHLEQSVSESHVCVKDYGQVITAYLGKMSPFLTVTGEPMFEARTNPAGGGTVRMIISDCPNLDVGWKLRQVGTGSSGRWSINLCEIYDQTNIYNPINWNTNVIGGLTGSIPPSPFAQITAQIP